MADSVPEPGEGESENENFQPIGSTEHLETVEYWKGLYLDAVAVGQKWQPVIEAARRLKVEALIDDDMDVSAFYDAVGDVCGAIEVVDG